MFAGPGAPESSWRPSTLVLRVSHPASNRAQQIGNGLVNIKSKPLGGVRTDEQGFESTQYIPIPDMHC